MRLKYPVYVLARADNTSREQTCDYSVGDVFLTCPSRTVMLLVVLRQVALPSIRKLCEEHGEKVWDDIPPDIGVTRVNLYHAGQPIVQ